MLPVVETARAMWTLFEPVHSVTYYAPEARAAFEAAGLRGFWRGYFASRAAPLGPVAAAPVIAAFFSFAPRMVERALPAVWGLAPPGAVLDARSAGAVAALRRATAEAVTEPAAEPTMESAEEPAMDAAMDAAMEAADLLAAAVTRLEPAGRVLGAANAALPAPDEPLARLWQAATTLREHRGDGHVAALVAAGLDGCEAVAWRAARDLDRANLQPARGWTDEEWDAATARLVERGWLDRSGAPTEAGIRRYGEIEAATDRAAAHAWRGVDTGRLRDLLRPLALACRAGIPGVNPIGLPRPA
jgi:hypothetical protein